MGSDPEDLKGQSTEDYCLTLTGTVKQTAQYKGVQHNAISLGILVAGKQDDDKGNSRDHETTLDRERGMKHPK